MEMLVCFLLRNSLVCWFGDVGILQTNILLSWVLEVVTSFNLPSEHTQGHIACEAKPEYLLNLLEICPWLLHSLFLRAGFVSISQIVGHIFFNCENYII